MPVTRTLVTVARGEKQRFRESARGSDTAAVQIVPESPAKRGHQTIRTYSQ